MDADSWNGEREYAGLGDGDSGDNFDVSSSAVTTTDPWGLDQGPEGLDLGPGDAGYVAGSLFASAIPLVNALRQPAGPYQSSTNGPGYASSAASPGTALPPPASYAGQTAPTTTAPAASYAGQNSTPGATSAWLTALTTPPGMYVGIGAGVLLLAVILRRR